MYARNLPDIWSKHKSLPCLIRSYMLDGLYFQKYGANNKNAGRKVVELDRYNYHIDIVEKDNYFEACFYKYGQPSYKKLSIYCIDE